MIISHMLSLRWRQLGPLDRRVVHNGWLMHLAGDHGCMAQWLKDAIWWLDSTMEAVLGD